MIKKMPILRGLLLLATLTAIQGCSSGNTSDQTSDLATTANEAKASTNAVLMGEPAWPDLKTPSYVDLADEDTISDIIASMSLAQKVGQMIQAEIRAATPDDVKKYHLGSILNGGGGFPDEKKYSTVEDWLALADAFYDASMSTENGRVPIPIIWGTDAVHGHNNVIGATLFPHNIGIGASGNVALSRKLAAATAKEVAVTGIDWTFAPTLAVSRDTRWGRTYESFSQDAKIVADFTGPTIKGFQGDAKDFLNDSRVLATAKHFVGDGGTDRGDDQGNALIDYQDLRLHHAIPYFDAIEAGVQTVMVSYSSINGEKMHGNRHLITDVLKGDLGFDGLVISDWNGIGQVPGCANDNCAQAVNAGIDLLMVPDTNDFKAIHKNLQAQVNSGDIAMSRIDDAVRRILRVKMRAGLIAPAGQKAKGKPSSRSLAGNKSLIGAAEHRALARQAVRESLVLFKNKNQILPLARDAKVFVGGSAADSLSHQTGGWTVSWQGTGNTNEDFPGATTVAKAVKALAKNAVVGTDASAAKGMDVAIVVFGEPPYAEFKGDIQNLDTINFVDKMAADLVLLQELKRMGIPTVAVFFSGRPLWVNPVIGMVDAFVVAWLPGTEGQGITDVVFKNAEGIINYDFRGRLSFQWPLSKCHRVYDPSLGSNSNQALPIGFGDSYGDDAIDLAPRLAAGSAINCDSAIGEKMGPLPIVFDAGKGWQVFTELPSWRKIPVGDSSPTPGLSLTQKTDETLVRWNGTQMAKYVLDSAQAANLTPYLVDNAVLAVDLKVRRVPEANMLLGMSCGNPCVGEINVAEYLKKMPKDTWQTLYIDLACFVKADVDMHKIQSVVTLGTAGKAEVSIGDTSLVSPASAGARVSCPF